MRQTTTLCACELLWHLTTTALAADPHPLKIEANKQ